MRELQCTYLGNKTTHTTIYRQDELSSILIDDLNVKWKYDGWGHLIKENGDLR